MNKWLKVLLVALIVVSLSYSSFAQEEDMEYAYGEVVRVNPTMNKIVIKEYDWENDSETDTTYLVTPKTEFEDIISLSEIEPDSYVGIEYTLNENGERIAKFISVSKPEIE